MPRRPIVRLNRFTTLPVLLDMLQRKKLVLLDPKSWDDRNDFLIIQEYKKRKKIPALFALCFSSDYETVHHWKTFAGGSSGCCIEFSYEKLAARLKEVDGVRYGPVSCRKNWTVKKGSIAVKNIPFTKRWPYRCEDEFRIIWEGDSNENFFEIEFDLSIINRITISQQMPDAVYETIRAQLRGSFKNGEQRVNRSTLYENKTWIGKFSKAP